MQLRIKKRRKRNAPAAVLFTSEKNSEGNKQTCVFVRCEFSGRKVGPIWGHKDESVRRALAQLTQECDCPARYHKAREYSGKRVTTTASN